MLGSAEREHLRLTIKIIFGSIPTYMIMIPQRHRQMDRQTGDTPILRIIHLVIIIV